MKKEQIFFEGNYEYDLVTDGDTISLYYNNGEQWTASIRGTLILSIIDTGNGYEIKNLNSNTFFDYSDVVHLNILLNVIKDYTLEISEKRIL